MSLRKKKKEKQGKVIQYPSKFWLRVKELRPNSVDLTSLLCKKLFEVFSKLFTCARQDQKKHLKKLTPLYFFQNLIFTVCI